jgi:hypothetical protein
MCNYSTVFLFNWHTKINSILQFYVKRMLSVQYDDDTQLGLPIYTLDGMSLWHKVLSKW